MMEYNKQSDIERRVYAVKGNSGQAVFSIMDTEEFRKERQNLSHYKEILNSLGSIRYCKAEVYKECIIGTLRIPQKSEERQPQMTFGFYMTKDFLYFIEDKDSLKKWIEKRTDRFESVTTPDWIFLQVMQQIVEDDIIYLSHFEKELENLENAILKGKIKNFFAILTKHRQKLSELNLYYEQLASIGDVIQSHDSLSMVCSVESWNRYTFHVERLQKHVHLLQENLLQLRELYQSQQDAQQNRVMCMLTIVTTLFLPLTLLTGWYGMNFAYMPELHWKYGYSVVIIVAILIVTLEIIYFKKIRVSKDTLINI